VFTHADLAELAARGVTESEAVRQLQLLRRAPAPSRLDRPCTIGDGIVQLEDRSHERLQHIASAAAAVGRVTKFVPASGAATRMFKDLLAVVAAPERPSSTAAGRQFFEQLDRFPFAAELRRRSGVTGAPSDASTERRVLRTLLEEMRYAELPKALIAFHRSSDGVRTAFEEHLLEGTAYTRSADGRARMHFTVAPEFRVEFEQSLGRVQASIAGKTNAQLDVSFSEQYPSTDTLALTTDGEPFRTEDGKLLFRPAGHGALLRNLQALNGDVVVLKNIDNVLPYEASGEVIRWKQLLIGCLVEAVTTGAHTRPVRVCGVVRNEGEPGGAPFWVIGPDGQRTLQLVESSQVDADDPEQQRIFASSTHFNPVDLVCAVRDREGKPYNLSAFVDPSAVFLAKKSHEGRPLIALERPGLWNGAMAGWHTIFVEVPAATFAPVKTVFDLLRPQHQSL
jgi:hypothetical protein